MLLYPAAKLINKPVIYQKDFTVAIFRNIILFIFILLPSFAFAQQGKDVKHINDVYKLPPSIYDVKGMGNWKKGSDYGQIRLVITRSSRRDEVYLQWVKWSNGGPESVVSTIIIKEIQESANYKTTFIRRETNNGNRQIVIGLENLHDKTSSKMIVYITGVGRYHTELKDH